MTLIRRVALGAAGSALLLAPILLVPGQSDATEPTDTPWIEYGAPPAKSTVLTVAGERVGEGACDFDYSGSLLPGEKPVQLNEIAYNPETCETKVARSVPAVEVEAGAQDGASIDGARAVPVPDDKATDAAKGTDFQAKAAFVNSQGTVKVYYEDPPQLDVNSVRGRVNWNWNGTSCIKPGWGSYHHGWLSESGWGRKDHNWDNAYGCNDQRVDMYAHFKNSVFCAFIDTHVYYDRVKLQGWKDGVLSWNVNTRKSGGCTGLLSRHITAKREIN